MTRSRQEQLKRKARIWTFIGVLTFIIGFVIVWERVSYNLHDFYAENYSELSSEDIAKYSPTAEQLAHLNKAQSLMAKEDYWAALTSLDAVKKTPNDAVQIAEWNKVLCMIALEEKEEVMALLSYYCEQADFTYKRAEGRALLEMY